MRAFILITTAALLLGACGKNNSADQAQNVDENLSAESIVANDVTAIDAVTGDAANMAADVNYEEFNLGNETDLNAAIAPTASRRTPRSPAANAAENSL